MESELLKSKLLIPPVRADLVPRPQLARLLDEGLAKKLALVSAPAGYGKTTLLSAWAQGCGLPAAWLSLDDGDNDPVRFLRYFQAALQGAGLIGEEAAKAPGYPAGLSGLALSLDEVPAALLNRIQTAGSDFVLILDDFHTVTAQPVHRFIACLVDHLPARMHLYIASRADPSLPLPRLRARGQLVEIRLAQLRFSPGEVADFLEKSGGMSLPDPQVAALAERTEGWAAGVQLAALSLQGQPDPERTIREFTGSNRFILDYLVDEVLEHQSPEIQEFLLRTSILERMCASLAEAILENREARIENRHDSRCSPLDSRSTLEHLEQSNLFLMPLDDRRQWYRYHRLFADLLQKRLQQTYPEQVPALRLRASRWFEANGMAPEAIEHALAARDLDRASGLIEATAQAVLMRGEIATLLGWIEQLPAQTVQSRPRLDLYAVTCDVLIGHGQEVTEAGLQRLCRAPELAMELAALRGYQAVFQTQISTAEELTRQALAGLPKEAAFYRMLASWINNACRVSESELSQRIEILEAQIARSQAAGNRLVWANSLCNLAEVRYRQGNLRQAQDHYRQAIQGSYDADGRLLPVAGEALIGLGYILREWNRPDEAVRSIEQGIQLIQQVYRFAAIEGFLALAMCRQAQGLPDAAIQALARAHELAQGFDSTNIDDHLVDLYESQILHKQGDHQAIRRYFAAKAARKEAEAAPNTPESKAGRFQIQAHLDKYEKVAWGRACLASLQPAEALSTLDPLLPEMIRQGRVTLVIEIELLRSLALLALGDRNNAQAAFEAALTWAEPGGFVRLFVDEGQVIAPLLQKAIDRDACPDYAQRLLEALGDGPAEAAAQPPLPDQAGLPEPLSARELEVLRQLRSSLSAKEIAVQMGVAESTINSHVKTIYGKLGVHRRMDAVRRAEELGLAPKGD